MDFSELAPERVFSGLAVLAIIPVVLFALWAEYFDGYVETARKKSSEFDPKNERDRIRIAAGGVLVFETLLFLGALDLVGEFPKASTFLTFGSILAVGAIQARLEKKLQPVALSAAPLHARKVADGMRILLFGVMSGFLYVFCLMAFVKAAIWIVTASHMSSVWGSCFVMGAAAIGILGGLTVNFALAPWQMKNSLSMTAMTEDQITQFKAPMERAGLTGFEYWIVEDSQATAAVAGFRNGKGIFRPSLFVSRKVMTSLTAEQITAIVAHEAAHVLAQHLKKRILLSAFMITGLTFLAVFATVASLLWMPSQSAQNGVGFIFGCAGFFLAYYVLQRQGRVHEFQADWLAVQKLGADFDAWANALRKMDELNGYPSLPGALSSHPRTEIRIQNVARMIEFMGELRKAEAELEKKRAA